MSRRSFGRSAVILALVLLLTAPWEAAAGPRLGDTLRRAAFSDSATPDFVSGFLSFVARLWDKAGCILDPHGQCVLEEKEGCGLDPHGLCTPIQVDNGCRIDPHGGCVSGQ